MEIKDLLTFAKAGYSPAQVKELLAIPLPEEKKEELQEPEEKLQEHEETIELPEENVIIQETKKIDYKSLYEDSQKKLQEAQKQNINQNMQGKLEDDQTIVTRFISSFL